MKITKVTPQADGTLQIVDENGQSGQSGAFDVRPYLNSQAFLPLKDGAQC
jgi:hypothetical protein